MNKYQEMNKYREALDNLSYYGQLYFKDVNAPIITKNKLLLRELVGKATPKKKIRKRLYYNCRDGECDKTFIYYCPVCNECSVENMNYCFNCGQALERSDEDD